jgi:prepilin-type N-terminal cleavage/methylation domain-containing protein
MSGPAIRSAEERGVTLTEMLVVLAILGIVLAGMTTLFVSATTSQADQSNRVEAQQNGRLALDRLRREIHCASAVSTPVPPLPWDPSSLTITLPGYCQRPAVPGTAPFTWCAVGASPTWALWRYAGSSCSGVTGRKMARSLISNSLFTYNRASTGPAISTIVPTTLTGGVFKPGTYTYDVTAVLASGLEVSGTPSSKTISVAASQMTVSWPAYTGAVSYNVYGRDNNTAAGLRKLASLGSTSYVDDYSVAVNSTLASPPLGTVGVSLVVDASPADTRQRFTLSDDIVLRNSGRR